MSLPPPVPESEHTAYIALGSNMGDRRTALDQAINLLSATPGVRVQQVSRYHETAAVGGPPGQGPYLNAAAWLQATLSPDQLLRRLLEIEQSLGRIRHERFGPRTVDLDLLLYDDLCRDDAHLIIPHPRMHERSFVLAPLAEIAAHAVHPQLKRTIASLLTDVASRTQPEATGTATGLAPLRGLRALVTGSTSGIGRAIALQLARAGASVILHGRRGDAAEAMLRELRDIGVEAHAILADLHSEEGCRTLLHEAWDSEGVGPIDAWINNAGADTLTGEAAHWSFERKLDELLAVDLKATLLLSREVGQHMRERSDGRGGVILTMGWDQVETGMEGDSGQLFGAVKGAVMAFTRSLALSLAPTVRVNCLAPGWIRTAWGEGASAAWQERVLRETPLKRWGTAEDVAATACWLVSPQAAYITGQIIRINGGAVRG